MTQRRVIRFLIIGGIAYVGNIALITFFIETAGWDTTFLRNLANLVTTLVSIVATYFAHQLYTWRLEDSEATVQVFHGRAFLIYFSTAMASLIFRAMIFWILDRLGLHYIVCMTISILVVSIFSYVVYDRYVFDLTTKKGLT
jgi:dolichol-phosphate mannosyltransferase